MGQRADLHQVLLGIVPNVYFQPPDGSRMQYPAIVYEQDAAKTKHAGNKPYNYLKRYSVTIIVSDPDSTLPDLVAGLPTAVFDRGFVNDQLNHKSFTLYF